MTPALTVVSSAMPTSKTGLVVVRAMARWTTVGGENYGGGDADPELILHSCSEQETRRSPTGSIQ